MITNNVIYIEERPDQHCAVIEPFKSGLLVCRRNQTGQVYHSQVPSSKAQIRIPAEKSTDIDSPEGSPLAGVGGSSSQSLATSRQACWRNVDNRKHKGHQ